jgi:hypothetical protein
MSLNGVWENRIEDANEKVSNKKVGFIFEKIKDKGLKINIIEQLFSGYSEN